MSLATVNDQTFDSEVLRSTTPVLVDFWGPNCGPCVALEPVVATVAREFAGQLKVVKVNAYEAPGTAQKYGVMTLPTMLLFKGGAVRAQLVGYHPVDRVTDTVEEHLD